MINDLKYKIPVKTGGSITSGIKTKSSSGKEIPKAVDHFVVTDFPELEVVYGKTPSKLVIFFPTNNPADFLDINYVLYGSNQALIRKCDGEQCYHRIAEEIEGKNYQAQTYSSCICKELELPDDHKKHCRPFFWMKAFIGDIKMGKVDSPMCYLFKSGSKNTAENIISEINKVSHLTGGNLVGVPFGLSVEMVSGSTNAGIKFPIWKLQVLGSITQIKQMNENMQMLIPTKQNLKLLEEAPAESLFNGE